MNTAVTQPDLYAWASNERRSGEGIEVDRPSSEWVKTLQRARLRYSVHAPNRQGQARDKWTVTLRSSRAGLREAVSALTAGERSEDQTGHSPAAVSRHGNVSAWERHTMLLFPFPARGVKKAVEGQ
ncbi:hypothetical protein AAFF_G00191180 [Aldrovandia affinis]|uniref:Uncharacterized protein n=1 Tax=Aldrovandia affinis TaxID=143900 RepID=A0AAD7W5Q6_9TELE|nr:hypothetical protein AAFF_G00191180 [Aldrovandia affinis]